MSAKSKSGLWETPINVSQAPHTSKGAPSTPTSKALPSTPTSKISPATPRATKLSKGTVNSEPNSHSPLQKPTRLSIDPSPRSDNLVHSKPAIDRRSPKIVTPPEKQPTRVLKVPELQAQLIVVQENLKKAKEQLDHAEKEKSQALVELKLAQKLVDESNEKLRDALVAQKRAEEDSEIEKFRGVELEQMGIENAQKKEEGWKREIEAIKNQHDLDLAALISTTQELQNVKQNLVMTIDAKNCALLHADDATKLAEIHAEKVESLTAELVHLKASLNSKIVFYERENIQKVSMLISEIDTLKQSLQNAQGYKEKLVEKEACIEQLSVQLENAKLEESSERGLVNELTERVKDLENQIQEVNRLENFASESLYSVKIQLQGSNDLLNIAQSEIVSLTEKMGLLKVTEEQAKGHILELDHQLKFAEGDISEIGKTVESLRCEIENINLEKAQALNNEKLTASSLHKLLVENDKLINELKDSKSEEEKSKKAMESLTLALHEVSVEARETQEKLLSSENEREKYTAQIRDANLVLNENNEKYEAKIDDGKHKIVLLTNSLEQVKHDLINFKAESDQKELDLVNCINKNDEEKSSLGKEVNALVKLLREAQVEASEAKEEGTRMKNSLEETESELVYLKKVVEELREENIHLRTRVEKTDTELNYVKKDVKEAKRESKFLRDSLKETESELVCLKKVVGESKVEGMKLKEGLLDKDSELRTVIQENKELRAREVNSVERVEELSKLIEEAADKRKNQENSELTDSEKDYDLLPKVVEFSEENGHGAEEKPINIDLEEGNKQKHGPSVEVDLKMWKSYKIGGERDFTSEKAENVNKNPAEEDESAEVNSKMWEKDLQEPVKESVEADLGSNLDERESFHQINGLTSEKHEEQRKKKHLLKKFGSLLKRKSSSNQEK